MFVRDGRTLPFVPVTLASQDAIRAHVPKRRPYAVATYIALLEFANDDRADRVAVTQRDIVERVGAGRTTVQTALADLQTAGVIRVVERRHGASRVENEYVIVEPEDARDESDTPARHTGDPRPPHGRLTQEHEEGEGRARAKAKIPEDFPPSLRPHLERVYVILRAVARERPNTPAIVPMALARVLMARPHKCLVKEAHDYAAWCAEKGYPHRNIVSGYRNRLDNSPTIARVEVMPEHEQPGQASANVTPIRGGRYDARAAKAEREASREAAARRLLAQQQPSV